MAKQTEPKETDWSLQPAVNLNQLALLHAPTLVKFLYPFFPKKTCCCCCCCKGDVHRDQNCVDRFRVDQELRIDPNSFGIGPQPLIVGTRAEIAWSVTAPPNSTVTVQIRTRGLDGNPGPPFADWTDIFTNQALIDSVRYTANRVLGTKVEFRVVVKDAAGKIPCVGPPDS
jgi:hypothetical protein